MPYIVSGDTYNYREELKSMGGKFNGKTWEFPESINIRDLNYIRRMNGVHIQTPTSAMEAAERKTIGRTQMHGDDNQFYNAFLDKDPTAFFGFSSLFKLLKYVDDIPDRVKNDQSRNSGWHSQPANWYGTRSMEETMNLARNGWREGVEKAKEISEIISTEHAQGKRREYSVAGGRVNVGRMLSGNPLHLSRKTKQPMRKVITLLVDVAMLSDISVNSAILRAACVAALSDLLEAKKFSCEIFAVAITDSSRGAASQMTTKLKSAGEVLNINDLVFMLGHSSVQRRLNFALKGSCDALHYCWRGMGSTVDAFGRGHQPGANQFYIRPMNSSIQSAVNAEQTPRNKARKMLQRIIPANLPITIEV